MDDMMPKGSLPVPWQKAQVTSTICLGFDSNLTRFVRLFTEVLLYVTDQNLVISIRAGKDSLQPMRHCYLSLELAPPTTCPGPPRTPRGSPATPQTARTPA